MKTRLIMIGLAALLCAAGCSPQTDRKVAAMEERLAALESAWAEMTNGMESTGATIRRGSELAAAMAASAQQMTNQMGRYFEQIDLAIGRQVREEFERSVERLRAELAKPPVASTRRAPAAVASPASPALKSGIPAAVYDQIAKDAAEKWPGDFEMQDYEISNQIQAYRKLRLAK